MPLQKIRPRIITGKYVYGKRCKIRRILNQERLSTDTNIAPTRRFIHGQTQGQVKVNKLP